MRDASPVKTNAEVEQTSTRVVVGKGNAYDLFLGRELKHAEIVREPTSPTVLKTFIAMGVSVATAARDALRIRSKAKDSDPTLTDSSSAKPSLQIGSALTMCEAHTCRPPDTLWSG